MTRAKLVIGDCKLPSNLERSSSLEGICAIDCIPAASYTSPSTTPALISNAFASFAHLAKILAGAVASVVDHFHACRRTVAQCRPDKSERAIHRRHKGRIFRKQIHVCVEENRRQV